MRRRLPLDTDPTSQAEAEFAHHLRLLVKELVDSGLSPEAAQREAERRFGSVSRLKAEVSAIDRDSERDRRRAGWWDAILQDLRFAWRTLRGDPTYSAVAILSLAIGVGATTTMISTVDAVDRRALRFPAGERLAEVQPLGPVDDPNCPRCERGASFLEVERWSAAARSIDRLEGWQQNSRIWHHQGEVESIDLAEGTAGFTELLGAKPIVGRSFQPADAVAGAPLVAVLTEEFWRRRLGADRDVVGSTLWLAPRDVERAKPPLAYTVIGVIPLIPGFSSSRDDLTQVWTALAAAPDLRPDRHALNLIARARPGVEIAAVADEFDHLLSADSVGTARYSGALTTELRTARLREFRPVRTRFVLLGVVAMVLLLVAVNVANLSLARAAHRRAELAIRASVGAGRGRLVRQVLTESVAVALAGGALGAGLAAAGTALASNRLRLPLLGVTAAVDGPTLGVALAISIVTGILFGLAPALGLSRTDPGEAFRVATARGVSRSLNRRIEAGLVVTQIAMALMLVAGAGLLGSDLIRLERQRVGFDPRGLYQVVVPSPDSARRDPIARRALVDQLTRRLASLPGFSQSTVFTGTGETKVRTEGGGRLAPTPIVVDVAANFLGVLGATMIRGRDFLPEDQATPVCVVTAYTAGLLWPGQDPIGRRLEVEEPSGTTGSTVIGVVADARWVSSLRSEQAVVYRPPALQPGRGVVVIARADRSGAEALATLTKAIAEVAGAMPAANEARLLEQFVADQLDGPSFNALVVAAFAGMALLLAAMGIAGVVALAVGTRTREIGIRVALGAQPATIVGLVTRRGAFLAAAGIGFGLIGAVVATRAIRSLLYLTSPTDPVILLGAALGLGLVATLAAWGPARRAIRLDPIAALRSD